jgi:hypothetical protein
MEDNLTKKGRRPKKNGRQPLKKKWKKTSKKKEDKPINQNQPNWL